MLGGELITQIQVFFYYEYYASMRANAKHSSLAKAGEKVVVHNRIKERAVGVASKWLHFPPFTTGAGQAPNYLSWAGHVLQTL